MVNGVPVARMADDVSHLVAAPGRYAASGHAPSEELLQRVRARHGTLEAIDPTQNLYRVTLDGEQIYGTAETLLDVTATPRATQALGERLYTQGGQYGDVSIEAAGGLAGTGAQGRVNKFPGDVDLAEALVIRAPNRDAASEALAQRIQATVRAADNAGGDVPLVFEEMKVGAFPQGHPQAGRKITWSREDVLRGHVEWQGADGTLQRYSLADALSEPGSRTPNTFWKGPIDETGTYGEVTKVMRYEAFDEAGNELFGTSRIGQAGQEVAFGAPTIHDVDPDHLIGALKPQVAAYGQPGKWLKSVKRAYSVAKLEGDLDAITDLGPLMSSNHAHLKQVTEHFEILVDDVITPQGVATRAFSNDQAAQQLTTMARRLDTVDATAAARVRAAITDADGRFVGNQRLSERLSEVADDLNASIKSDTAFADEARSVLMEHGYQFD